MSVLIRGMDEIPGDGVVLVVKHDDNGKVYIKYANTYGYSIELVKLPEKHGRLIDAEALIDTLEQAIAIMETVLKQFDLEADDGCLMELKAYRDIRDGIKEIDAVIEAEDEG